MLHVRLRIDSEVETGVGRSKEETTSQESSCILGMMVDMTGGPELEDGRNVTLVSHTALMTRT